MPAYLPPELWICVAESLYHDYETSLEAVSARFTPAANFTDAVDFASLRTLAILCRVSKAFRDAATPFLYRIPIEKEHYKALLLRILATSPELSRHVRQLFCSTGPMILSKSEMNQSSTFLEAVERKKEFVREHLITANEPDGPNDWWDQDEEPLDSHVLDAALIAILPNLVGVTLGSESRHVCFGFEPGSLPKLTSVYITHDDGWGFLRPHRLKHLAEAASNLTLLHLYLFGTEQVGDNIYPLFPNVTTLMLDSPVVADVSWPFLLQAFPRLKTLSCSWGEGSEDNETATVQDIQNAVVECCPHLKTLCVDASYINTYNAWPDVEGLDRGLASLQELEQLMTDLTSIGKPELDENGEETGNVSGICIEALPASLRSLRIFYTEDEDATELAKSLLDLAAEVHRFPALKEVSIVRSMRGTYELDDQVMSAWKNTGAELTLRTPSTLDPSAKFWDWL